MFFTNSLNSFNLSDQLIFFCFLLQTSQIPNLSKFKLGLVLGKNTNFTILHIKYYVRKKNFTLITLNKNLLK